MYGPHSMQLPLSTSNSELLCQGRPQQVNFNQFYITYSIEVRKEPHIYTNQNEIGIKLIPA